VLGRAEGIGCCIVFVGISKIVLEKCGGNALPRYLKKDGVGTVFLV